MGKLNNCGRCSTKVRSHPWLGNDLGYRMLGKTTWHPWQSQSVAFIILSLIKSKFWLVLSVNVVNSVSLVDKRGIGNLLVVKNYVYLIIYQVKTIGIAFCPRIPCMAAIGKVNWMQAPKFIIWYALIC